jgi:hypothetical protein
MRRGFWITVGAAGGIMGYRRVAAAGRTLSGRLDSDRGREVRKVERKVKRGVVRGTIRFGRDARRFTRDVREGMDLYIARHPERSGSTLGANAALDAKDDH